MTTLTTETTKFGNIRYTNDDVVTLQGGLVGFPGFTQFVLIQHRAGSQFRWLQSLDNGDVAFLVVDPAHYVDGYAPEISDSQAQDIGLQEETPRLVYTIVTIPPGKPDQMTINLAGPIVVNLESGRARQIVIEDECYPIKHKVFDKGRSGDAAA